MKLKGNGEKSPGTRPLNEGDCWERCGEDSALRRREKKHGLHGQRGLLLERELLLLTGRYLCGDSAIINSNLILLKAKPANGKLIQASAGIDYLLN